MIQLYQLNDQTDDRDDKFAATTSHAPVKRIPKLLVSSWKIKTNFHFHSKIIVITHS